MEYKVVPFKAVINQRETTDSVAIQLQKIIDRYSMEGWKYNSLESVSTYIKGDSGCFGIGATPGFVKSYQMVVFERI